MKRVWTKPSLRWATLGIWLHPLQQSHEYSRDGTAKRLTLFHPADGQGLVKGVRQTTNASVHDGWSEQLLAIVVGTLA